MRRAPQLALSCGALAALGAACSYDWSFPPDAGGGSDGAVVDGASGSDGSSIEAGGGGDGGGPFTCDGALFCDTFEGETALTPKWADTFTGPGSTLRIEGLSSAPTPPNVLFAGRDTSGGSPGTSYATKVVTLPLNRATLSFKFRPESFGTTARACIAGIVFNDGAANEHVARLLVGSDSALLQEKTPTLIPHAASKAPDIGVWSRMTISVEVGGHIVVTQEGVTTLDVPIDPSWTQSTSTRIVLGINFSEDVGASFALHFDDVRFDGS